MRNCKKKTEQGFTLFEIVFVMAIFAIMSSITIFRFDNFSAQTSFTNLTQDIALRVVTAQKTATSGALNSNFTSAGTAPVYGITFTSGTVSDTANRTFTYFTDYTGASSVPDGLFNSGGACNTAGSECLSTTTITTGQYVSAICYLPTGASPTLSCPSSANNRQAHITFKRPFPDAMIKICGSASSCPSPVDASKVLIEISSTTSPMQKTIVIKSLGQVRIVDGNATAANAAS
jgi:prepilin-type N-terminal cleavage/methylation domain-containing protein